MKGSIGGATQLRSAAGAGCSFRKPSKKVRFKLRRQAQSLQKIEALAHRPVDLTPRLNKRGGDAS